MDESKIYVQPHHSNALDESKIYVQPHHSNALDESKIYVQPHHSNALEAIRSFGNHDNERGALLLAEIEKREAELNARARAAFEREQLNRVELEQQKTELEKFRQTLKHEQAVKEDLLHKEYDERRRKLDEQLHRWQQDLRENEETLRLKLQEVEAQQQRANEHEIQLAKVHEELEREKERYREESRKKIESTSSAYVNEALAALESNASTFQRISKRWSVFGSISLMLGILTGIGFGILGLIPLQEMTIGWPQVVFFGFKGVIVVALFVALAKYCFVFGQSFMHESLKNRERQHAIKFGKFYLESYGADADWKQVKEAFEHWNIVGASAFVKNDPNAFDPQMLENASKIIDSLGKIKLPKNEEKTEK